MSVQCIHDEFSGRPLFTLMYTFSLGNIQNKIRSMSSFTMFFTILLILPQAANCISPAFILPGDCRYDDTKYISVTCSDCVNENITHEDIRYLPNITQYLTIHCSLDCLHDGEFQHLAQLRYLRIDAGRLTHIQSGAFQGLWNIKTLILNNHFIKHLENGIFQGLTKLENIDLSHNEIKTIDPSVFVDTVYLSNLTLFNNKLDVLDVHWFKNALQLKYLDIGGNNLKDFPNQVLGHLTSLVSLISHQSRSLQNFDIGEEFLNLTHLQEFNVTDLDVNRPKLSSAMFVNLRNCPIVWMDLSRNNIYQVANDTFKHLTHLKYLNLNMNNLENEALRNVFLGLRVPFLQMFSIIDNQARKLTIERSLFDGLVQNNITVGDFVALNCKIGNLDDNAFVGTKIIGKLCLQVNCFIFLCNFVIFLCIFLPFHKSVNCKHYFFCI